MKRPIIQTFLDDVFALDIRSLAFFRIALGANLLYDLAIRSASLQTFYADAGILPRVKIFRAPPDSYLWSLHFIGGSTLFQAGMFLLAGFLAIGLMIGWRTRLMTFLSWVMLCSLHNRMPYIQNSADVWMRLSLLWSVFIPLGTCWSIDRAMAASNTETPPKVCNAGTVALWLQTVLVYISSAVFKFRGEDWFKTGDAVYYVLSMDVFATSLGRKLLSFPILLKPLTYAVMFYEFFGPLFLLIPLGTLRLTVLAGFFLMHVGFGLSLSVDPFPRIALLQLIPFLPALFWERIQPWLSRWNFSGLTRWMSRMFTQRRQAPYPGRWGNGIAVVFFLLGSYPAVQALAPFSWQLPALPGVLNTLRSTAQLDQAWNIFAPGISRTSGWYVVVGTLQNGRTVDLYRDGAPVSWEPPPLPSAHYKNERWQQYMIRLFSGQRDRYRDYSEYLCRSWNLSHEGGDELDSLIIYLMATTALPDHQKTSPTPLVRWKTICGRRPPLPIQPGVLQPPQPALPPDPQPEPYTEPQVELD